MVARRFRPGALIDDATLSNDAPITEPGQDRLGFGELARHLANVFLRNDLSRGLVVGIEGEWGSGKSSLANLALGMLDKAENAPSIVRFSPWIVGNRSELLRELFLEFDKVLYNSFPAASRHSARTLLRRYANSASALAAAGDIAAAAGLPVAGAVSQALKHSASAASNAAAPSLVALNEGIRRHFQLLPRPVVVFIDDIDRLEPIEAIEVLRLGRAVADFPNVDYLLAYDPDVLASSVKTTTGVPNGHEYIAKIVQTSFTIPEPMRFDLRSWLASEIRSTINIESISEDAGARLDRSIRSWCLEYIATPRDLVRLLNSFKLHVVPIAGEIDLADGLFVQVIRTHHRPLYDWVEKYVKGHFAIQYDDYYALPDHLGTDQSGNVNEIFVNIVNKTGFDMARFMGNLQRHLPEISIPDFPAARLNKIGANLRSEKRQLWSPSYFRFYFALSMPRGSLSDREVDEFLDRCTGNQEDAVRHFRKLCNEFRPQGGIMATLLLTRIGERRDYISPDRIRGLFLVLADTTDDLARQDKDISLIYTEIITILSLVKKLGSDETVNLLREIFCNAKSFVFLNMTIKTLMAEHVTSGHREMISEQCILDGQELKDIKVKFLARLQGASAEYLAEVPNFLSLMYGWYQAGGQSEVRAWIAGQIKEDDGFLDIVGRMVEMQLHKDTLDIFFESSEQVMQRLEELVANGSGKLKGKADKIRSLIQSLERQWSE